MCGRFTLRTPVRILAEHFSVFEMPDLAPRFNIAPTQPVPVVRLSPQGEREVAPLRWGLVPSWAKDPTIAARLINARCETVAEKRSFQSAFRHRRCLVMADGFYEWQRTAKGKQPWLLERVDSTPFAMAGLWERWQSTDGTCLETCTVLTTAANDLMRPIHDRMPVMLVSENYAAWLATDTDRAQLNALMRPFEADAMKARRVGTRVNQPSFDGPECLEPPGDGREGERQRRLF